MTRTKNFVELCKKLRKNLKFVFTWVKFNILSYIKPIIIFYSVILYVIHDKNNKNSYKPF